MSEDREYLPIIVKKNNEIEVCGFARRDIVHSNLRIPHISVNIIPIIKGSDLVILHKRSNKRKVDSDKYDFNGGHIVYGPILFTGKNSLGEVSDKTALREAREEIWISTKGGPHIITSNDLFRFTGIGDLLTGFEDSNSINVGFMTGYILIIPDNSTIVIADENEDGTIENLFYEKISIFEIIKKFQKNPEIFASGAKAILKELVKETSSINGRFREILKSNLSYL